MAQFSYEDYAASKQANHPATTGGNMGPEVHFMNEFLHSDGDVAIVRFPYHSMNDISFETTHSVTFPFKKYPSRVRCPGENCPLCAEGTKVDMRFFVKLLVYVIDETSGNIKALNAIWDRPAAFAEIDIKNLMEEYGDLTQNLFKIKRNGLGTQTRYTTSIITNKTVYNPDVYVADFTELEKVDAARILSKSVKQYSEAFHSEAAGEAVGTETVPQNTWTPTPKAPTVSQDLEAPQYVTSNMIENNPNVNMTAPAADPSTGRINSYNTYSNNQTVVQPASEKVEGERKTVKFTF